MLRLHSPSIFGMNILAILFVLLNSKSILFTHGYVYSSRYEYPPDELNLSYSQEEYGHSPLTSNESLDPEFVGQVPNITVQVGRDARLSCIVRNLNSYSVAWIHDEKKSILTLQRLMVTRDQRISLQEESQIDMGGPDGAANQIRYFVLVIKNVQESDRGGYMCQLNTNPMKSQIGTLRVVVPPEIIDQESSSDVTVVEGANVTLQCKAKGHPNPTIEWRREDGNRVPLGASRRILTNKTEGELLDIVRVTRVHSGAWLCIAHNGIMPSVSRRILLNVRFSPQIWIPVEEVGAPLGSNITLDCHIEAYPVPLSYWTFGANGESIYISGPKYEISIKEKGYKRHLRLVIHRLEKSDLGTYRCHAENEMGKPSRQVRLFASETHQQIESKERSMDKARKHTALTNGQTRRRKKNRSKLSSSITDPNSSSIDSTSTQNGNNHQENKGETVHYRVTNSQQHSEINNQNNDSELEEDYEDSDDESNASATRTKQSFSVMFLLFSCHFIFLIFLI